MSGKITMPETPRHGRPEGATDANATPGSATRRELLYRVLGVSAGAAAIATLPGCGASGLLLAPPDDGGFVDNDPPDVDGGPVTGVELVAQSKSSITDGDAGLWALVGAPMGTAAPAPPWPMWTNRHPATGGPDGGVACPTAPADTPLALEQWVDARRFGARGDGCTDDRPAIQAAIESLKATGGTVFLPAGTYIINPVIAGIASPLLLRSGVSLVGAGRGATVLKLAPGSLAKVGKDGTPIVANLAHAAWAGSPMPDVGVGLAHLTLDGNLAQNLPSSGKFAACVAFDNVIAPRISDVAMVNSCRYGLLLGWKSAANDDGAFDGLSIAGAASSGIYIVRGRRHRFVHCHVTGSGFCNVVFGPNTGEDESRDHSFVGCAFDDANQAGGAGVRMTSVAGAALENVSFVSCDLRGNFVGMDIEGPLGATPSDVRVVGCTFARSVNSAIIVSQGQGCVIGCSFIDNETSGSRNGIISLNYAGSSWQLTNNRIKPIANAESGIALLHGTTGHTIIGNQYLAAGNQDYFVACGGDVDITGSVIHSNIGGRVFDKDGNASQHDLHTLVSKATGAFTAAELQNGRCGYRIDTAELVFNIDGVLRKIATQPA